MLEFDINYYVIDLRKKAKSNATGRVKYIYYKYVNVYVRYI